LQQRVHVWPVDRLVSEIGRQFSPAWSPSHERDYVLLREFITRDITINDLRALAIQPLNHAMTRAYRSAILIRELGQRKDLRPFETFIREEIEAAGTPDEAGFLIVQLRGREDMDFCGDAVPLVSGDRQARLFGLEYLKARGHTREIYEQLKNAQVPPGAVAEKERTLAIIKARLEQENN
jgi:hypothetical protein